MVTLKLSERDYRTLLSLIGFAVGGYAKDREPIPDSLKEAIDWILIQGHPENYTYWNHKEELRARKQKQLDEEAKY